VFQFGKARGNQFEVVDVIGWSIRPVQFVILNGSVGVLFRGTRFHQDLGKLETLSATLC
jgi:hypothetical protein